MSFTEEKKQRIRHYLLEKIRAGQPSVVKHTAQAFGVTPASVHKYLHKMEAAGILRRVKRDRYELISQTFSFVLSREKGELRSEDAIYTQDIFPLLRDLPKNVQGIWDYLCEEMLNNVIDHSGAGTLEIEVNRDALQTTVRIADDGVGIFEKIRAGFELGSADEALGELLKGKVTTDETRHSGEGIFFSSHLADTFVILSSGLVFTRNRFDGDSLQTLTASIASHAPRDGKGTTVYMTLANDSNKQAKDVFDLFADTDGGFTKTRIPLRNYFEDAPVSRSQAKRLVNRLERFADVELDFEGLEWMGQGFAHELFVVFQNAHPEIRLLPLNMNDDVKKMFVHVTNT